MWYIYLLLANVAGMAYYPFKENFYKIKQWIIDFRFYNEDSLSISSGFLKLGNGKEWRFWSKIKLCYSCSLKSIQSKENSWLILTDLPGGEQGGNCIASQNCSNSLFRFEVISTYSPLPEINSFNRFSRKIYHKINPLLHPIRISRESTERFSRINSTAVNSSIPMLYIL